MNPKELKKLIKLCRDMGVQSYEGDGFKFTLTDSAPVKTKHKSMIHNGQQTDDIESDSLTAEQLLWWSAPGDGPVPMGEDK